MRRGAKAVAASLTIAAAGLSAGGLFVAAGWFSMVTAATVQIPAAHSAMASAGAPVTIVLCSPGSPGDTEAAAPTMAIFARAAELAASRPAGSIQAVYHETEEDGLARLARGDAAFALVPLPFYLKHASAFSLEPRLLAVEKSGARQKWSLVAKKGRITSPAALDGWEIASVAGYSEPFIRTTVLGAWGSLPVGARVTFTGSPLGALRRAAAGETIALVLDAAQGAALASLPFATSLETVAESAELPRAVLCAAGSKGDSALGEAIVGALARLHDRPEGAEALEAMRLNRFEPADRNALQSLRRAFEADRQPGSGPQP